jgi:hypothetical protein
MGDRGRRDWLKRRDELAKLRAETTSVYENRRPTAPEDDDRADWHLLAEVDMATGRWTWHEDWKPFGMSPLSRWRPFGASTIYRP